MVLPCWDMNQRDMLKCGVLLLLVVQNSALVQTMRYSRSTGDNLYRGVEALTSHAPMAIFSRAQFATPVSRVTKDNILNTLNKVGVNFQRTKKSYALFWFSEPFA